ncbi:MAG TPA: fumarylacetoacetate hydrolase family protein [Solirubrobacterales bacterium]|jgi:2-keto-4-pentenoate hydratase/2-oxohepta-3-ene-1,7-dioic acid hydratase in catechol pathway
MPEPVDPTSPGSARFALGTFDLGGEAAPHLAVGEDAYDLRPLLGERTTIRRLLGDWDASLVRLARLVDEGLPGAEPRPLARLRPLPPVQPIGQVFQAAANYRRHVLDLIAGAESRGDASDGQTDGDRDETRRLLDERATKGRPFVFLGTSHGMVGAEDEIILPADSDQSDWELELAAVIGRHGRRVPPEAALDLIAGFTIVNDLTSRDALARRDAGTLGIDWLAGKGAPSFLPVGPLLVPAKFVDDPQDLRIQLTVNGRVMQDESTADMLFDVAQLVSYVTTITEIRPGDIILTGSPAGNGASHGVFLKAEDVIEGTVTGLGVQRNRCVAEASPA